jgi:hypothetical protein
MIEPMSVAVRNKMATEDPHARRRADYMQERMMQMYIRQLTRTDSRPQQVSRLTRLLKASTLAQ